MWKKLNEINYISKSIQNIRLYAKLNFKTSLVEAAKTK